MGDKESSSEGEFDHGDGSSEDEDGATIHINIEQSSSDDELSQDQFTSTAKPLFLVYESASQQLLTFTKITLWKLLLQLFYLKLCNCQM